MPEQQQPRPQLRGNQCNVTDVMRKISLSKPPVDLGMYRTLYMKDYQPFPDQRQQPRARDHVEKLTLEAQLKAKEFAWPIKNEPVKYAEDPACQEVQPPYPTMMERRLGRGQYAQPPSQPAKKEHQNDFHAALPSAPNHLLQHSPPVESVATQEKEAARPSQQVQPSAMPDSTAVPCVKHELGQNWDSYQQFMLETQRASHAQAQEIKTLNLGCSVFPEDFISDTAVSTYQRDYKHWLRVHTGFCRAHRNFSNLLFEDGYYSETPWMSEYMDNYSIFLQKLNWKSRNPISSFCSAIKPVPHLSYGTPSQTPIAL